MKRLNWIAVAVVGVLPVAACGGGDGEAASQGLGGSWSEIVERANDEGTVTWYTGLDEPSMLKVEEAFEKAYPEIDGKFVRMNSSELAPRVDAERQTESEGADVLHTSTEGYLAQVQSDDQLEAIQSPAYDELLGTVFEEHPGLAVEHWYAPFSAGTFTIVWNTDEVSEPIESYADHEHHPGGRRFERAATPADTGAEVRR